MSAILRDMSKVCERCGAAPSVACRHIVARGPGLEFVFPCDTSLEQAQQAWEAVARELTTMGEAP